VHGARVQGGRHGAQGAQGGLSERPRPPRTRGAGSGRRSDGRAGVGPARAHTLAGLAPDAEVSTAWQRGPGQVVRAGDALRVTGIRGQVVFRQHVRLADGREWVDVVHPEYGFHSVRPKRVRAVPRKRTVRPARFAAQVAA